MTASVVSGVRLGPYEIRNRIGGGGMGEVWQARDTRLDRSVAVKVLPAEVAADSQVQLRFEQEAKAISQLNHPNICTVHDVGCESGVSYLVMELLDGESLADRLSRGPLPMADVLRYGAQIAEALDRAHRAGIVHRDLKPGNVMLTRTGAKLLDFGLAKSMAAVGVSPDAETTRNRDLEDLNRSSKPLTAEGAIVGTFQYMAPEQLEGGVADARTDIFALGVLLYEMATGRRAFQGKTQTSLIAAIMAADPPSVRSLQPFTPPALEHVIVRALQKDPDERWQSARDVAQELRWIGDPSSQLSLDVPSRPAATRWMRWLASAIALALLAALGTALVLLRNERERSGRVIHADLEPPPGMYFNNVGDHGGPPVISPDGRLVAFSATDGSAPGLWIRNLSTGEVRPLNGTRAAIFPFWSPDSRTVAFFAEGTLKRIDISGGAPISIAPALNARGGAWAGETIVFAPGGLSGLSRVAAAGGKVTPLTKLDGRHTSHRWPSFLPDGRHLVYLAGNHQDATGGSNGIYLASLEGGEPRLILNTPANAIYSRGHLLFVRDDSLYAQRMAGDGELLGEPQEIRKGVLFDRGIWKGGFSVSDSGDLVYCAGQAVIRSRVAWVDRQGKEMAGVAGDDRFWDVRLSPDEKKVAVTAGDPSRQLWVLDLEHKTRKRIDLRERWAALPAWSPDGSRLLVNAVREDGPALLEVPLDGGRERVIAQLPPTGVGSTFASDGKSVIYAAGDQLWRKSMLAGEAVAMTNDTPGSRDPQVSPDGRWLAWTSSLSGRNEVFVSRSNETSQRWQVSETGGSQPSWSRDGKELFYVDNANRLTAVRIALTGDSLGLGSVEKLFTLAAANVGHLYDPSADGKRFIINFVPPQTGVGVKVITNWDRELERRR